jgi:hypothetical protein
LLLLPPDNIKKTGKDLNFSKNYFDFLPELKFNKRGKNEINFDFINYTFKLSNGGMQISS